MADVYCSRLARDLGLVGVLHPDGSTKVAARPFPPLSLAR